MPLTSVVVYIPVIVAGHILPSFELQVGEISSKKKRYEEGNERLRDGREGGRRRRKSTADSCNPRSLSQLGMIVMESLRQKPEEKTLHWQARLCQPLKRLLYTIHQPLCLWDVDKREIWPRYISAPSMMQLKEGQT